MADGAERQGDEKNVAIIQHGLPVHEVYPFEFDIEVTEWSYSQDKPDGWDDPDHCAHLMWRLDGYREHLRRMYCYFKYRYFHAMRPLLTIADETEQFCDRLWTDPLLATEYAYNARIAPKFTLT